MAYTYEYPRPALTVDCVIFGYAGGDLQVLLIERDIEPFQGSWALPGGFVRMDETLEEAALRELREETGVEHTYLEQLYTFSAVDRDPRGRVVTASYFAIVKVDSVKLVASTDARNAKWFSTKQVPALAFDHADILSKAVERLKSKVRYQPIGFELLPKKFTLTQLQDLYETVLQQEIDKRNFRKKILSMGLLTELSEREINVARRPARYYSFDRDAYKRLSAKGFLFEL